MTYQLHSATDQEGQFANEAPSLLGFTARGAPTGAQPALPRTTPPGPVTSAMSEPDPFELTYDAQV